MSVHEKNHHGNEAAAPLTSKRLRDMVLDHMLEHAHLFLNENDPEMSQRFVGMLTSLTELAENVATQSIANRQCLSPLPTFDGVINPDPEKDLFDPARYEMRYRLVEQIGNEPPYKDEVYTLGQAREEYGESFVESHWGLLGENCPARITVGERNLWFTAVRYPIDDPDQGHKANAHSRQRMG